MMELNAEAESEEMLNGVYQIYMKILNLLEIISFLFNNLKLNKTYLFHINTPYNRSFIRHRKVPTNRAVGFMENIIKFRNRY